MEKSELSRRITPSRLSGPASARKAEVVILHGAFSHGAHFSHWVARLAANGVTAIAPTLRDTDDPIGAASGMRFAHYVERAHAIIRDLDAPPVVIGHSMGGLVAQKLAEAGACRGIVLVASAPPGMLTAQPRSLPALAPMMPSILKGAPLEPRAETLKSIVLHHVGRQERDVLMHSFVPESGIVYREMIFGAIRVRAENVRCPVLCIGGEDDRIVSTRLLRATARRYDARCIEYKGRGHWLIAEPGWEQVVDETLAWLRAERLVGSGEAATVH